MPFFLSLHLWCIGKDSLISDWQYIINWPARTKAFSCPSTDWSIGIRLITGALLYKWFIEGSKSEDARVSISRQIAAFCLGTSQG